MAELEGGEAWCWRPGADLVPVQRVGNNGEQQLAVLVTGSRGGQSVDISWQRLHRRRTVDGVEGGWRGERGRGSTVSVERVQ